MRWKILLLCTLLLTPAFAARATDPITCKEIAMLLRNGEDQQFIISDTAKRKLLQPLTKGEQDDLVSLGATPALMKALCDPAMVASPDAGAAYAARVQQQKLAILQEDQEARLEAEEAAAKTAQPAANPAAAAPPAEDYTGKPLTLKFTAADGSPVDLAGLRGKVVLVDFWATWCGPCMHEVPDVVAAYKKYHGSGFEVIGVSLDQSKEAMLSVTAEKEMTWPQYFDGKGWSNEIATTFHIRSIPTMWLVNKSGIIAYTNARADLDGSIQKLLAQ